MKVKEVRCKSAIVKSKLPDADYVINPYTGCEFGCSYCYASFMCRFVNEPISSWGNFINPKINIIEVLKKQLDSKSILKDKSILMSSVTDPYTYIEQKYELTRGILVNLFLSNWAGRISLLTKSPLVTRDIDIFKQLQHCEVGMTITSNDNQISKTLEKNAPFVRARIKALEMLNNNGIKTYAFIGPIIPSYMEDMKGLDNLFEQLKSVGVDQVYMEFMNLKSVKNNVISALEHEYSSEQINAFLKNLANQDDLKKQETAIKQIVNKHNIVLKLSEVIQHS